MNLTDDQIRSLRATGERFATEPGSKEQKATGRVVLSLVEEVQRLRGGVCPTPPCQWPVQACAFFEERNEAQAECDALAAKAEAGKGLYEALKAFCEDLGTFRPEFELDDEERAAIAALARWEAVENG